MTRYEKNAFMRSTYIKSFITSLAILAITPAAIFAACPSGHSGTGNCCITLNGEQCCKTCSGSKNHCEWTYDSYGNVNGVKCT